MKLFFSNITNQSWNFCFKVFLLVGVQHSISQNLLVKTIEPIGIDRIVIKGDQIFEIEIYSEDRKTIEMTALQDGEYENDFQISANKFNGYLEIQLLPVDFSDIPDDKRNAHKVVSATLKLIVPHDQKLEVVSDVGFLIAQGRFNSLMANLQNGYFRFNGVADYLRAETTEGNIYYKSQNTTIEAYSAKGKVIGVQSTNGSNKAILRSIRGDISINTLKN